MTMADWAPVFLALIGAMATAITTMAGIFVPRAITAFEHRTHIALTQQERDAVMQAVKTEAGLVETALQKGGMRLTDTDPHGLVMLTRARAAIARVPDAAKAVGITTEVMASMIVGATDTTKAKAIG